VVNNKTNFMVSKKEEIVTLFRTINEFVRVTTKFKDSVTPTLL